MQKVEAFVEPTDLELGQCIRFALSMHEKRNCGTAGEESRS